MTRVVFLVVLAALTSVSGRCPSYEGRTDCSHFKYLREVLTDDISLPRLRKPLHTLRGLTYWLRSNTYEEETRGKQELQRLALKIKGIFSNYYVSIINNHSCVNNTLISFFDQPACLSVVLFVCLSFGNQFLNAFCHVLWNIYVLGHMKTLAVCKKRVCFRPFANGGTF